MLGDRNTVTDELGFKAWKLVFKVGTELPENTPGISFLEI